MRATLLFARVAVNWQAEGHFFKVPEFLNCEGTTFDPIWSVFRESAILNAQAGYPRNESLRDMAVELISTYEPSMIVGTRAWVVRLRTAATGDVYHLRSHLGEDAEDAVFSLPSSDIGLKATLGPSQSQAERDPMEFCLYGYVQALFIEFRHTIPVNEEGSGLPDNDPRLATCHDRRPLLEVAEQLLGGETCETNFLESSDWPLNSLDLHLSLHSTLALRSSSDCHVIFKAEDYISRPLEASWVPVPESELLQDSFQLRIAALGLHVASTLEPVAALREVARAGEGSSIDISYFGHPCYGRPGDKTLKHACVYKCQMLGSPCEDDPIAELLKSMFNSSGFYEEVAWSPQEALEVLGHEWRRQSSLAEADLIVCSGPLALCYLVDILAPATFMVMTLCSQLLWGAPPGEHVGTMLLGQVRLMSHNPRRALVACNLFAASQCLYQTGVELPVVERVAHYLPHGVYWGSTGAESHWKEVLVLRARYWHRLPGQYFMDVLEAFLRTNEFGHNFTFVMAASFGPDELPPEEIARYRAAVLVPNDLTVFAFIEVYALGVPTFVPLPSWLYRLRRAAPFGFLQRSLSLPDLTGVRDRFKYPPFLSNDREDFAAFLHWQQTSELHTRPHVQQFGSVPHLLYITASADLLAISKGMKEYNSQLRNISATCWSSVLQRFSGSSRATPVGIVSSMQTAATSWVDAGGTGLQAVLDCSSDEYGAWNAFRLEFQSNAALGFVVNWELQAMAQSLWNSVQGLPENFAAASALFHQVLLGDAPPGLVLSSGHCHYGLVSALFILARHRKTKADTAELAMRMLGGFAALDFLEDSAWPLSSLDLAKMMSQGEDFCHFDANGARLRSIIEANLPWTLQFDTFHVASPAENVKTKPKLKSWKAAIVGAHPSLCADIAHAVDRALGGQSEHQYFGLSCPGHHSASHHCTFRCEVLGQCSNDAMFDRILGQMLNWGEFTERPFDPKVLLNELRKIVSSSKFLSSADLQICTGPYVLCHMMQLILDVPLLVYLGLTLTYLAAENVEELLLSARSIASDFTNLAGAVGPRRRALVVTDLIRAAQFHHATGVWVPALPPLSFYHADPAQGGRHHRAKRVEAIALRPELWRRAAFGPGLRGLLRHFCNSNTGVAFQTHFLPLRRILSYDAAILVPWDNDVMSFYELYHAAMPLLMPSEMLMSKWLPAVRWGSLEFDRDRGTGSAKRPACLMRLGKSPACFVPWMNQSTLQSAMDGGAASWIGATDYYRFPHILHFHSVASLVGKLQGPLAATRSGMRKASQEIRSQTLSLHRRLLGHLLGFGDSERFPRFMPTQAPNHWNQLPLGGTCKLGFIAQADFPQIEPHSSPFLGLRQCLRLCDETAGCEVAVFNGLTCMVYDEFCNATDLRREGDRNGYVAWKRD